MSPVSGSRGSAVSRRGDQHPRAARALLIQPPVYDFALYDLFHQPYGLLRIGAWMEQAGYSVHLVDCLDPAPSGRKQAGRGKFTRQTVPKPSVLADVDREYARYGAPEESVRERVAAARPDLIMVATGMTYWYPGVAEIGRLCREICPGIPVVAGGVYASLMPAHCAAQLESDHIVSGEAGASLPPILARLSLPIPDGEVPYLPSVSLREPSARLCEAAAIRLHEGCSHSCAYCASPVISPKFRTGDPNALVDHVAELHDRFGVSDFAFYDDALLHKPVGGIVPFLQSIVGRFGARPLVFHVPNAVHLASITDDLGSLMYRAGFAEVRFGLESTDPVFHATLDQKLQPDRLAGVVASLFRAGFRGREITAYVLLGLPGQEFSTVRKTLDDARNLGINASVAEYSPVPGTPLFRDAVQSSGFDLAGEPLLHNNSVYSVLSGHTTAAQMQEARSSVRRIREGLRRDIMA